MLPTASCGRQLAADSKSREQARSYIEGDGEQARSYIEADGEQARSYIEAGREQARSYKELTECPPSTLNTAPVMKREASLASSSRAPSRSAGSPSRRCGTRFTSASPAGVPK